MDPYRHKVITDPVHGAIGLSELETAVINSPTFQRLRRLKQLGLASLVYPNADHSRFAHSLGVFHLMGRGIDTLIHKGRLSPDDDKQKLRLAALLHDVGTTPIRISWNAWTRIHCAKRGSALARHHPRCLTLTTRN